LAPMLTQTAGAAENSFTPGTIKSLDAAKKTFVMVRTMDDKTTKDINVTVTDQTTYSMDGKSLTFADLKVGQTITCENVKKTSTERTAVAVKVAADAPKDKPAENK